MASCGTALTPQQAQQLRRFTGKVVLSFDPDAAGQGAAAKSCEMLVAEGFEVNVAILPAGRGPRYVRPADTGREGYGERLRQSQPYLEYLLDRAAAGHNLNTDEGTGASFCPRCCRLPAGFRTRRCADRFADRLAHQGAGHRRSGPGRDPKGGRAEADRRCRARELPSFGQVTKAEKGLIWWLVHEPEPALAALDGLEPADLEGWRPRSVLDLARKLNEDRGFSPSVLLERLSMVEAQLVTGIASEPKPPAHDARSPAYASSAAARYERERAAVQREIDRLQQQRRREHSGEIDALLARKRRLGSADTGPRDIGGIDLVD